MTLKLSRKSQARSRLIKNLTSSLILYGQIKTTLPKAKATKQDAQRVISRAQTTKDVVALNRFLRNDLYGGAIKKLPEIASQIKSVSVLKLDTRFGDGSQEALVILNLDEAKLQPATQGTKKEVKKAAKGTK